MNREIRAIYNNETIRVYQAYNEVIANEAVQNGTFGDSFSLERMSWIKPSFLWMMYRCGWGTKENQEHILAIDIKRKAFDYIVNNAICSSFQKEIYSDNKEWKELLKKSDLQFQWDPDRDIFGNPLPYRAIQLGLRRNAVRKYVNEWIVNITDITKYVNELKQMRDLYEDISKLLPDEKVYKVCSNINRIYNKR